MQADEASASAADATLEDAKEIVQGRPYHWKDWCVVRGRDCLYLWSDVAALELSNGSNGWFRFILDGKLATMYSSGSPEGGSDSSGMLCILLFTFRFRSFIHSYLTIRLIESLTYRKPYSNNKAHKI